MNTRIIALTCALTASACGGADRKPAQDPAARYNSAAPSQNTTVASATDPAAQTPNTAVGTTTTTNGRETAAATSVAPSGNTLAAATNPGVPDQAKSLDSTKVNERDRRDSTLTPMDQGNSASETKITAAIRRGIMGDKNLSFAAKNVKIITVGTKVTLRGQVVTEQEKAAIDALAKQTAGVSEVDNQLEVKK